MAIVLTDATIQEDVIEELKFDPEVVAPEIGVRVKDGVVTLSGAVESYATRWASERAAKRVAGVKAVANEIGVRLPDIVRRTDEDIARDAIRALELNASIPAGRLKATVDNGWVRLEGAVDWAFQRSAAERTVQGVTGVKGLTNLIKVEPRPLPDEVKSRIKAAFIRNARLDAKHVKVEIRDHVVELSGVVRSHSEKAEAERIAYSLPGVIEVDNRIAIEP